MFTLPAYVGIILKKDTQVLLVKRCNTDWASECWNFPGGLLEANETLLEAAIRETKEEVNVIVEPHNVTLVHVLQIKKDGTNTKDIIGFYFTADLWHGIPVNNEPNRHSEIGWFEVNSGMPHNVTEHAKQALYGLQQDIRYSEN